MVGHDNEWSWLNARESVGESDPHRANDLARGGIAGDAISADTRQEGFTPRGANGDEVGVPSVIRESRKPDRFPPRPIIDGHDHRLRPNPILPFDPPPV